MTTQQQPRRTVAGEPGPVDRGGLGAPGGRQAQHQAPHQAPYPGPAAPHPGHPTFVVAPSFVPYGYADGDGDGAVVMSVAGGGVRRLSKRASNVVIAAIVFATCVVPLVIAAIVYLSMPDVDGMLDRVPTTPSVSVESR